MDNTHSSEIEIQALVEHWARAVREKNMDAIVAHHTEDMVMFDVPPPFESVGLEAYKKTWETFFKWTKDSVVFDIVEIKIVAGEDVAFCYATMRCAGYSKPEEKEMLQFRLTVGLVKKEGDWYIQHEHHSVPSV